jgi:hypothetical protein
MHCIFEEEKNYFDSLVAIYKKSEGNLKEAVFEARKLFSKNRLC